MSSHHFVREGQEPALFILDPLPFSLAGQLLEWVPLVIVHQQALENVLSWGIKIDVLLTSKPQSQQNELDNQGPLEYIPISESKPSGLINALEYLLEKHYFAVNIMGSLKPEWLHLPVQFPQLTISFIDETTKWHYVQRVFEKWLPAHSTLLLIPLHNPISTNTNGLIETETKHTWMTQHDGLMRITADHGFWVGEIF